MEKLKICVSGSSGFIAKNLLVRLHSSGDFEICTINRETPLSSYKSILSDVDIVYHTAGVNRPPDEGDFKVGNETLTEQILESTYARRKPVKFVLLSSAQAALDNPYGKSKLAAENHVKKKCEESGFGGIIYRLPGVFGKWSRPNYNSVVATFCYNIANNLEIQISNPEHSIELVYIDDVVNELIRLIDEPCTTGAASYRDIGVHFNVTLGRLAEVIRSFPENRQTLATPKVDDPLVKNLYSTYLSFLPRDAFSYPMQLRTDDRGCLFEWVKQKGFGQIFVSTTKPGITRGNHYHHTKTEKFLVIQGSADIQFRRIDEEMIITYSVNGQSPEVVDIPPGYTHSITNTGDSELITLFWANEVFDSNNPDTYFLKV